MSLSQQLTGRRRAIGNRNNSNNNNNNNKSSTNKSSSNKSNGNNSNNGNNKYRVNNSNNLLFTLLKRVLICAIIMYVIAVLRFRSSSSLSSSSSSSLSKPKPEGSCKLRKYPKRRYYGLNGLNNNNNNNNNNDPLPDFLKAEYIYGELPRIIEPKQQQQQTTTATTTKLCVDQTEWLNHPKTTITVEGQQQQQQQQSPPPLPFADGTNPSILKLIDNPRIDQSIRDLFIDSDNNNNNNNNDNNTPHYLATICMTNSQCSWNDSPEEILEFNLNNNNNEVEEGPSTVRTVLLVLNKNFETLMEATIYTKIDAKFGGRRNVRPVKPNNNNEQHEYESKMFQLDDARLFTHKGQIWVSYREGKLFGYEKQVLNKLHFDFVLTKANTNTNANTAITTTTSSTLRTAAAAAIKTNNNNNNDKLKLAITLLASETETLCCGRNMALIDNVHTNQLQALTWVDPVTVVDVDTTKTDRGGVGGGGGEKKDKNKNNNSKNFAIGMPATTNQNHRRLDDKNNNNKKKKSSHFHGTNGFMVHLPNSGEYLGIGHFHRPNGREKNEYARFGHHYTHAFFTITDTPPFRLTRLSPELVLPSHAYPKDAEIIQFWSGLELVSSSTTTTTTGLSSTTGSSSTGSGGADADKDKDTLALAYGINDCEGAATYLDLAVVEGLLRDVPEGKEVVDFMMPLK